MELYEVCARMIERGKTKGLRKKLDVFYASDRLSEEEYKKLCQMLGEWGCEKVLHSFEPRTKTRSSAGIGGSSVR